ncbi:related to AU-binding enoyl-CoA hydratase; AU-specific RNA-binding enoyl-CoA hydratase [Rhynchosporium agropyri]|uniref:Related to AU-binding enoyl-CoA hydratase AU-specific RNA-binding enoyl-CoA hydratase n=1 Tax=Rhynchosporium agropyri TaxID=914238 RepID=A0A1E1LQ40_9HELO|nr:related to AU-binding enoyl-CoA hydratase; AU-specific RNA-binding enoyl-CoA hydratase [Rhynchosporium agropyri]
MGLYYASLDFIVEYSIKNLHSALSHIRILSLNCSTSRNAILKALLSNLDSQIFNVQFQFDPSTYDELPNSSPSHLGTTRALIVASEDDKCFCAGADLKERKSFTDAETVVFLTLLRSSLNSLEDLPIPVIAAIAAPAFGGGFELALAAHMRVVGSPDMRFPETRLPVVSGAGGGEEALRLGMADCLLEEDHSGVKSLRLRVLDEAVILAREICRGGPVAIRMTMWVFKQPGEEAEDLAYRRDLKTQDRKAALAGFAEKEPAFVGR